MVNRLLGGSVLLFIVLVVLVLLFPSLAPATHPTTHSTFIWGILHGFLAAPTWVAKLFHPHQYNIYQTPNSGIGYEGGFLIGAALFFGLGSRAVY